MRETRQDFAANIRALYSGSIPRGLRLVGKDECRPFTIDMSNRFLTSRGEIYKRQELHARYERTTLDQASGMIAPARYTWTAARLHAVQDGQEPRATEWTFARGTSFRSLLFCAENRADGVPPPDPPLPETKRELRYFDVAYPSLPKSPAVDLLRLLSWDVVTFEMLVSHVGTAPALTQIGATASIDRVSNTWAQLGFGQYASSSFFKNGLVTATLLGHSLWLGRPCAIYSFDCDRSELDVHAEPGVSSVAQRGSSFYSGKLWIDVEQGDLVAGDMMETIIALVTNKTGATTPVQKQRYVQVALAVDDAVSPAQARSLGGVRLPPADTPLSPRAQELCQTALAINERFAAFTEQHQDEFEHLPQGLKPLAEMGFQSFTGNSLPEQATRATELSALLTGLRHGPTAEATRAFTEQYPAFKRSLEGFILYTQIAPDEAARLQILDDATLHDFESSLQQIQHEVSALIAALDELEAALSSFTREAR